MTPNTLDPGSRPGRRMDCIAACAPRSDGQICLRDLAACFARGLACWFRPLWKEGAGNAGRPMRPIAACAMSSGRCAHALVRSHRNPPGFPTQWLYGLCRTLPGDRTFLPPSLPRSLLLKNLTPASRRQDHTILPSAEKRSLVSSASPRPPHPAPRFVTLRNAPAWTGMARQRTDLPFRKTRIFLQKGLDRGVENHPGDLPVRQQTAGCGWVRRALTRHPRT